MKLSSQVGSNYKLNPSLSFHLHENEGTWWEGRKLRGRRKDSEWDGMTSKKHQASFPQTVRIQLVLHCLTVGTPSVKGR